MCSQLLRLEPATGIEPVNLHLTKMVLYQLSYAGKWTHSDCRQKQKRPTLSAFPMDDGLHSFLQSGIPWILEIPHKIFSILQDRFWWAGQDSNLRRHEPAILQTAPFDRFGTDPLFIQFAKMEPTQGLEP